MCPIEQAKIITDTYKANEGKPRILTRAPGIKGSIGAAGDSCRTGRNWLWGIGQRESDKVLVGFPESGDGNLKASRAGP